MMWIGGAPGAGKSTIARALAHEHDLPLHPIDRWTYDHVQRLGPRDWPPPDPEEPDAAAEVFVESSRERLALVRADVRARDLGEVPAVVEGPQLFPDDASGLRDGWAVWLVPDAEQTRSARERRLAAVEDPGGRARLAGYLARDAVLARRVREGAVVAGRPVVEVGADPDWVAVRRAAEAALAPALGAASRLEPGARLAEQRRFENRAAARQIRLWVETERLDARPEFPFACECGRSRCAATWPATVGAYEATASDGPVVTAEHR
ncbi:hypothetical protein Bcav_0402 [Beutenbergia cavernae DSM 12333]|uniref:Uncharacterized protein n=2 Tax=Beutenbergia TaxID=84756 RepID=C5BWK8_BEUC1|nr:hypothetical protein Bcav_0402 [Beutenbergia cavernae DSM 12333]